MSQTGRERVLWLQCDSGISGDMVVGALLGAGADEQGLREALGSLGVEGYEVRVTHKMVGSLAACDFDVVLDEEHDGHDHDMAYLYGGLDAAGEGHERGHGHGHGHGHHHDHAHGHHHDHEHGHGHHHVHRHLADVRRIIEAGRLTPHARELALSTFDVIADAEAKAHGTPRDEVHLHEVGAVDSIVDVVAACWCVDNLGVDEVCVSALGEGHGRVRTAHGVLSVPVPAVANIVSDQGLVLKRLDREGEFVTPTGAALAAALRSCDEPPASYRVLATGVGSGKRAYDPPSSVRALVLESVSEGHGTPASSGATTTWAPLDEPQLWKLETEVDDCPGEALARALERLYEADAREAHFLPVFMKKNRPGWQIEVVCEEGSIAALEEVLFEDTTTIGIRRTPLLRTALPREAVEVETPLGTIRAKRVTLPSGERRSYPEYESVAALARERGLSYQEVYGLALVSCRTA